MLHLQYVFKPLISVKDGRISNFICFITITTTIVVLSSLYNEPQINVKFGAILRKKFTTLQFRNIVFCEKMNFQSFKKFKNVDCK